MKEREWQIQERGSEGGAEGWKRGEERRQGTQQVFPSTSASSSSAAGSQPQPESRRCRCCRCAGRMTETSRIQSVTAGQKSHVQICFFIVITWVVYSRCFKSYSQAKCVYGKLGPSVWFDRTAPQVSWLMAVSPDVLLCIRLILFLRRLVYVFYCVWHQVDYVG